MEARPRLFSLLGNIDDFYPTTLIGDADFHSAPFRGKLPSFFAVASFDSATFSGKVSFYSATFSGKASFDSATFSGKVSFSSATFSGKVSFSSATFSGDASFNSATFINLAYFNNASFFTRLLFTHVDCREYADLRNTQIRRLDCNSVRSPTIMSARFDLRGAVISEAHIQDVIFEKDVYFSDAKFGVLVEEKESTPNPEKKSDKPAMQAAPSLTTVFRFVTFESSADFKRAEFRGNTAFENVTFLQDANFIDTDFNAEKEKSEHKFSLSYLSVKCQDIGYPDVSRHRLPLRPVFVS